MCDLELMIREVVIVEVTIVTYDENNCQIVRLLNSPPVNELTMPSHFTLTNPVNNIIGV